MRVVVATPDRVGARMAGPGMRALHIARELARRFDVQLVAEPGEPFDAGLTLLPRRTPAAIDALSRADVVISQPTRDIFSIPRRAGQRRIFDLFDPVLLELRELYGPRPSIRQRVHLWAERRRLLRALREGDLLLEAAPAQRRYYASFDEVAADRWLHVSFGCDEMPESAAPPFEPPTLVWNGGVWPWLDAETAILATRSALHGGIPCRLLFLGTRRPSFSQADPAGGSPSDAAVQWNDTWVPYSERGEWLRRCKVAIMLHRRTPEAEFSVRTRLFDAISAGLPVIASEGGYAADLVARHGLGIVVPPGDVAAVASAIGRLLRDDAFHRSCVSKMKGLAPALRWDRVVAPLLEKIDEWQARP